MNYEHTAYTTAYIVTNRRFEMVSRTATEDNFYSPSGPSCYSIGRECRGSICSRVPTLLIYIPTYLLRDSYIGIFFQHLLHVGKMAEQFRTENMVYMQNFHQPYPTKVEYINIYIVYRICPCIYILYSYSTPAPKLSLIIIICLFLSIDTSRQVCIYSRQIRNAVHRLLYVCRVLYILCTSLLSSFSRY